VRSSAITRLAFAAARVLASAAALAIPVACSSGAPGAPSTEGEPSPGDDDAGAPPDSAAASGPSIRVHTASAVADVPRGQPASGAYRVHLIDVGTGLAVLVQGHDFNMLFDGGSNDDQAGISSTGNRNRLLAYLFAAIGPSGPKVCVPDGDARPKVDAPKLTLTHVFLSHPHNDHVSMLDDVLQCYRAANVWDAGVVYQTTAYRSFVQAFADDAQVHLRTATVPSAGKRMTINGEAISIAGTWEKFDDSRRDVPLGDGASFKVLHADGATYEDVNQNSIVLSVKLGEKKLLLMGDAESGERADPTAPVGYVEKFLLQVYASELKSDIMQIGHHGSKTSSRLEFLRAVSPTHALISSGPTTYAGIRLPDVEVVDAIGSLASKTEILRTDTHDGHCPVADRVGMDDGAPGGCDNYVLEITR
jgi:competence protein ComEC